PALAMFVCATDEAGAQRVVTDTAGQNVAFDAAHPYDAADNGTQTTQWSYGESFQVAVDAPMLRRENHFVAGASFDGGRASFTSQTALARLSSSRGTLPTDIVDAASLVAVDGTTRAYGVYATDNFAIRPDLFLTLSGRANFSTLSLEDQLGDAL